MIHVKLTTSGHLDGKTVTDVTTSSSFDALEIACNSLKNVMISKHVKR